MTGLSSEEAKERLLRYGPNQVIEKKSAQWLMDLRKLILDPGGLMLLVLGILYWILGNRTDSLILFAAYLPITAIDVALNIHSGRVLKELKSTLALQVKTYRDGVIRDLSARDVVPDDVILLEEGITLPADGILIECGNLLIDESSLTGESMPVEKKQGDGFFAGTTPFSGNGVGKILLTGTRTEFGKIGKLVETTIESKSPLRKKVDRLVRIVFTLAMIIACVLFLIEWLHSKQVIPSLISSLTLGMSAIPEEFPIVFTLYLSLGAWRLSKKKVLVKSLPSVEALGSVDVICTDKTGTLTEGRFHLSEYRILHQSMTEERAWLIARLACEPHAVDPMEVPIAQHTSEAHLEIQKWFLIEDHPFDPVSKTMSHRWKNEIGETIHAMKGALEGVLERCHVDEKKRTEIMKLNSDLASKGMRLLAVAGGTAPQPLEFIGLLVYDDPVRASASEAVMKCRNAGIEVKMITGDHLMTAHSVANRIGLPHLPFEMHSRETILAMNATDRKKAFLDGVIFARFTPELKHELVETLKSSGKTVAMTGDGINDAPALRLADIGISMGKSATDVARSAAKMVLIENDFSGIVAAVFEGRRIFENLQKSFSYLISFHTPVILLSMIPPFAGWPPILMPTHIILLELIVHPVSAFTFENMDTGDLRRNRGFMGTGKTLNAIWSGAILSVAAIGLYRMAPSIGIEQSRAMVFFLLCLGNAFFVFSECWPRLSRRFIFTSAMIILFAVVTTTPAVIADRLHFHAIDRHQLILVIIFSTVAVFRLPGFRRA